ncbi:DNA cytosine methyltransferase [Streptomyces antimycoticus]|uniref:DNA cytosine methyltransferase n=1 Tax=Streptomyces antimycoticus TaxID=68175 RepID=UPI0036A0152E
MTALSLCSGVGALDLAVEQATGIRTEVYAEPDQYAAMVMASRFPGVPNLGDITAVDWAEFARQHPTIDTLIAGWPCQGISHNGHRLGLNDPRSGIWRNVVQAIAAIRPHRVFLENVAALKTRGLDVVAGHMVELGYDFRWMYQTAGAVGAAHTRPRWFGYATPGTGSAAEVPAPAALYPPLRLLPTPKASDGPNGGPNQRDGAGNYYLPGVAVRLDEEWRSEELGVDYGPAVRRWAHIIGRPAPGPTAPDARGNQRLNPAAVEWLMGYPEGWVMDVPDIPRSQQIKLGGNGVVILQGASAYQHLAVHQPLTLDPGEGWRAAA